MNRLQPPDGMLQFFAEQYRALVIAGRDADSEEGWDPLDKSDREEIAPGSVLKLYDDVEIYGYLYGRVIAPAAGRTQFFVYWFDPVSGGHNTAIYGTDPPDQITDRAPADPTETPMPIVPPPESPP